MNRDALERREHASVVVEAGEAGRAGRASPSVRASASAPTAPGRSRLPSRCARRHRRRSRSHRAGRLPRLPSVADAGEVRLVGGADVDDRVPAELLERGPGELEGSLLPPRRPRALRRPARRALDGALAGSPLSRSTESSGRMRVGSSFIPLRARRSARRSRCPPRSTPARFVRRWRPGSISSCASVRVVSRRAKPLPMSTP